MFRFTSYFSRKYPIQLIIKNVTTNPDTLQDDPKLNGDNGECESSPTKDFKIGSNLTHQSSNESVTAVDDKSVSNDLGSIILLSDVSDPKNFVMNITLSRSSSQLQVLQDRLDAIDQTTELQSVPCGDDTRILLFARCDREKEDWFRRFTSASVGAVVDHELQFPDMVMVNDDDVAAAVKAAALANQDRDSTESLEERTTPAEGVSNAMSSAKIDAESDECIKSSRSGFEGLLLTTCAARGPSDYVKFMTRFQVGVSIVVAGKFIFWFSFFGSFCFSFFEFSLIFLLTESLFPKIHTSYSCLSN